MTLKATWGNFANDWFDDNLNNADLSTLKGYSNDKGMTWAIIVAKGKMKTAVRSLSNTGSCIGCISQTSILCQKIRK
jgi:hypothetical protein